MDYKKLSSVMLGIICCASMVNAHFTMVFPSGDMDVSPKDYIAQVGETKDVLIAWGHPYEHILFDMTSVPEVSVISPQGREKQLSVTEVRVPHKEGPKKGYKTRLTVEGEGDWIISVKYKDAGEELVDNVKAVIHCGEEAWYGWDNLIGREAEIVPYTRPYGMEEGFVFSGKAYSNGKTLADAEVEVEIYHPANTADGIVEAAESKYPYDPPMVFTRVTKADGDGDLSYTLDEPGIWFVCVTKEVEGEFTQRGVFIVPVLEAFPPKAAAEGGVKALEGKVSSLEGKVNALSNRIPTQTGGSSTLVYLALSLSVVAVIVALTKK